MRWTFFVAAFFALSLLAGGCGCGDDDDDASPAEDDDATDDDATDDDATDDDATDDDATDDDVTDDDATDDDSTDDDDTSPTTTTTTTTVATTTSTTTTTIMVDVENLIQAHHPNSPDFESNCTASNCHADIPTQGTLDANIKSAHVAMLPYVGPSDINAKCVRCHRDTELVNSDGTTALRTGGSAGNMRRNVDVAGCVMCHDAGSSNPFIFYQ